MMPNPFLTRLQLRKSSIPFLGLAMLIVLSCGTIKNGARQNDPQFIELTLLQLNDFYEISPLEGGKTGGIARISTIRKKLLRENPNTYTVLAGDFLSPTLLGTLKWEGERVRGKQMVEALNALKLDLATFGNHEFDLDEASLQKRLNESNFDWVSSNVQQVKHEIATPFRIQKNGTELPIPKTKFVKFHNAAGNEITVGFVAPCLPANKVDYVHYDPIFESVSNQLPLLQDSADFIISLSHLNKEDDLEMAKRFPQINLILGGHEHENMLYNIGRTRMTKADANAKTLYKHSILYNLQTKKYRIKSELIKLNDQVAEDPELKPLVDKWKQIETKIIRQMGFEPDETLIQLSTPLDARESTMRNQQCAFGSMITNAMSAAYPGSLAGICNSGSVRVDDLLSGSLSQYDILRSLPYGGAVVLVEIKGSLLNKVLEAGENNKGSGGYLLRNAFEKQKSGKWKLNGASIDDASEYRIAFSDFLLSGKEKGLGFLTKNNADLKVLKDPSVAGSTGITTDIRSAIIDFIKNGGRW